VYEMRSESGSGFSFKVEGNKFVNKIWYLKNNYFAHLQTV
jgi:hypothetical protein